MMSPPEMRLQMIFKRVVCSEGEPAPHTVAVKALAGVLRIQVKPSNQDLHCACRRCLH